MCLIVHSFLFCDFITGVFECCNIVSHARVGLRLRVCVRITEFIEVEVRRGSAARVRVRDLVTRISLLKLKFGADQRRFSNQ